MPCCGWGSGPPRGPASRSCCSCCSVSVSARGRHADRDRARLDLEPVALRLAARTAVELVEDLAIELDLHLPPSRDAEAGRPLRVAGDRAADRPRPLGEALGGD